MKRSALLTLLLVALAGLLPACGDAEAHAATVNGETISLNQVDEELAAIRDNKQYVQAVEQQAQAPILGQAPKSLDSAYAAFVVRRQIIFELIQQENEKRDLKVTKQVLDKAGDDLLAQVPKEIFDEFPEAYRDQITEWNAAALVLQADLLDLPAVGTDLARDYFEGHPDEFEQACTNHILVEGEQEAKDLRAQLVAGADFAALAKANSLDTGSKDRGGDAGCAFGWLLQPEYAEAMLAQPVGEIGEPVKTALGWHIIKVRSREVPKYEDVATDVQQRVQQLSVERFQAWLEKALTGAKVSINPRYGTWNETTGQVDPPNAPTTTEPTIAPREREEEGGGEGEEGPPVTGEPGEGPETSEIEQPGEG